MAIKIYSVTFLVLYNKIEATLKTRYDPAGIVRFRKNDRSIWTKSCPIEKIPLHQVVFPNSTYAFYFNEKKSQHNALYRSNSKGYLNEPAGLMYDAFQYLGYKLDEKISVQIPNEDFEVRVLYQFFLNEHCNEFYKNNIDELRVYDEVTGTILKTHPSLVDVPTAETTSTYIDTPEEFIHESDGEGMKDYIPEGKNSENVIDSVLGGDEVDAIKSNENLIVGIKQLVDNYVNCINTKNFDEIFNLFSKKQKKKMGDNPKYISELFRYTLSISEVNLFKIGRSNTFDYAVALVYYEERKDVSRLKDASDFDDMFTSDVDNIHLLKDQYRTFEKELNKHGIDWAGRLKVEHLFREDFISYLWANSLYDPSDIERIFSDERKQKDFHRLYKFRFEKTNDCWLIADIISINAPAFIDEFKLYLINQYMPLKDSMLKRIGQIFADGISRVLNRVLG